jgi:outer membrane protein assembly factor BamE (lipoprotein component of BamABCDE complex)
MKLFKIILLSLLLGSCATQYHKDQVEDKNSKLTLGNVQQNIKVGMSGAEVARVMGSPNMVTKDGDDAEVWIYDKISTVTANSSSSVLGVGGIIGGSVGVGGLGTYGGSASSRNQKTLTVIIKLKDDKVTKVDYNASSF